MSAVFDHICKFLCHTCTLTIPVPLDKFSVPQEWGLEESYRCGERENGYQQYYYSRQTQGAE